MPLRPNRIRLDVSTVCQLKCPTCPTSEGRIGKLFGTGFMRAPKFAQFLEANPFLRHIELSNWGEILLNPDLDQILEIAFARGVTLSSFNGNNLNFLREKTAENLVKYKFEGLTCSIDGATNETYSIYRKGGNFERVISNIRRINEWKARYQSELPVLRWQFIAFGHNESEIDRARLLAQELGMEFRVKLSWDEEYSPVRDTEQFKVSSGLPASSRSEFRARTGEIYKGHDCCKQLWNKPAINWDGRVVGCVNNSWGTFTEASEQPLLNALQSEKLRYARRMIRGKAPERGDIPCVNCWKYRQMKENSDWVTLGIADRVMDAVRRLIWGR